jgi:hypothetical protein
VVVVAVAHRVQVVQVVLVIPEILVDWDMVDEEKVLPTVAAVAVLDIMAAVVVE